MDPNTTVKLCVIRLPACKDVILTLKTLCKIAADYILFLLLSLFSGKIRFCIHVNHLLGNRFTWNVKPYFFWNKYKKKIKIPFAYVVIRTILGVKTDLLQPPNDIWNITPEFDICKLYCNCEIIDEDC